MQLPALQIPNIVGTIGQAEQVRALRQAAADTERFNTTLGEVAPILALGGQGPEYSSALARLMGAGPRGATMALPLMQREQESREFREWMGQGAAPAVSAGATPAVARPGGDYMTRLIADESSGDPNARNPRSSATGTGQFINETWLQFAGAHPELFQGMSRDQILAARTNPDLSRRAIQWYRDVNSRHLSALGLPANDGTVALAHRFGPQGAASLLRADPNAPVASVVGEQVMAANPDLAGRTVGQVVGRYAQRFGGGEAAAAPAAGGGIDPATLRRIEMGLASPNPRIQQAARAQLQMMQLRQQNNPETYREETREIGGRQVRGQVNSRTGQFTPYAGQSGAEQSGPFGGTGMEAQANNIVLRLAERIRGGTATPEEQALYQRAYTHLAEGSVQFVVDPSDPTGQRQVAVRVPRNMGDLPQPGAAGAATMPTQAGAPGAGQAAVPAQAGGLADATAMPTAPGAIQGMERITPPPAGYQRRPDGTVEPIPGGPQDPARQTLSEAQGRSNMFGNAMRQAEGILGGLRIPSGPTIAGWRNAPEIAVNPLLSANDQQYFNALRLFAAGILRKETGAAFTATELLDVQSRFFPMPGDSQQVLAQKAAARRQAIASMQAEMPGGQFRGAVETPGPGGVGTAEPPPPPPAGFRVVR